MPLWRGRPILPAMIGWLLYLIGIAVALCIGWVLRGWRDEDRAARAALAKVESERWAEKKWVKPPRDYPYP